MKCEKCNAKEATFFYSSNVNGTTTQRHLCADCAREEGFGGALDYSSEGMFGGMLDGFGDLFSDFFAPARSMLPTFGSFGRPMRSRIAPSMTMPSVNIVIGDPSRAEEQEASESKIPTDAGADVKTRRETEALRQQLEQAVKDEDFEKAIELRDQLKKLEG